MKFKKTALPNGVRVITAPMAGNPTATVMISVGTGSFHETAEQAGISHFLEHVCFKGTAKRPTARAITTELDSIGAAYNAYTGRETTGYWAKADIRHFDQIGDIIADIFKNSVFPEAEIEREKGVIVGEIDMYGDDPQEKIGEALLKHMYAGEPAERDILGTKSTVRAVTRQALVDYRSAHYTGPSVIISLAGGISEETMLAYAQAAFGDLPAKPSLPEFSTASREQRAPETVFIDKDTDQAHVVMAWRTFPRSHPDRYVAHLITSILRSGMSSRLFIKLRDEMGSGYYISASHALHQSFGHFSIATGTAHERVAEIVAAILALVERLQTEPVPQAELDKVKEFMHSHRLMSLETSDEVADYLIDQEAFDGRILKPTEFDAIFSRIGAEDIMRVARDIFDRERLTVAAIGKGIDKKAVEQAIVIREPRGADALVGADIS